MSTPHTNRLSRETSPYLLQHQHNPVDWYPWGQEAFERARAEDRPILLSIGYSACHWCHVMERESFEDETTAELMNEGFINVKVDREERPDVDSLYMAAVQRITGHGGWPMTVFITPDGEPFYGGTYFPPVPRHGIPSFRQVLLGINEAWTRRRDEVRRSADELTGMLREATRLRPPPSTVEAAVLHRAFAALADRHEEQFGGFGSAPKFPQPLALDFALRYWSRSGSRDALRIVQHTLRSMARGGMYDQLGGGFHRYSVDGKWLVPHFEKMLYDNALLSRVYLHAYQATGSPEFRTVAEETLEYVMREMTSPEGGFNSAQDADSEGVEGKFYVWTPDEIDAVLGEREGEQFRSAFGVTETGNFEGKNILNLLPRNGADPRDPRDEEVAAAHAIMARARDRLYAARAERIWPGLDDKVITSWNAMMMRSFAEAGRALDRADLLQAATRNARFLREELWRDGELLRTHRSGEAKIPAFLEDHALLIDALVSLYEGTFDPQWIDFAVGLASRMLERFWSQEEGIFYDAAEGSGDLVVRPREINDSATPSGTSAAAKALLRLGGLTGEARYGDVAAAVLGVNAEMAARFPQAFGEMLAAMDLYVGGVQEVAIVDSAAGGATPFLRALSSRYLPRTVVAFRPAGDPGDVASRSVPLLRDREPTEGGPAAYVCRGFTCQRPAATVEAMLSEMEASGAPAAE